MVSNDDSPTRRSNHGNFAAAQNVRFWHKADIAAVLSDVRFRGECVAKPRAIGAAKLVFSFASLDLFEETAAQRLSRTC